LLHDLLDEMNIPTCFWNSPAVDVMSGLSPVGAPPFGAIRGQETAPTGRFMQ
jgi:hypothetical protein